ncbi:MAG: GtrA family protein [Proteobacteria bacterium]|nr:GtrA family protein [Pseudomonadota bacterium]MBI3495803.1 GtrA family protein [Pseudomonadota bacterium]
MQPPLVLVQLFRFAAVGAVGFFVDAAVLYLLIYGAGLGPLLARLPSFLAASAVTWIANRTWTYGGAHPGSMAAQWGRFVLVNGIGGILNYAIYALCLAAEPFRSHPVLAVAVGSLSGLACNFAASRRFVFGRG